MHISYGQAIGESEEELSQAEQRARGQRMLDRVRMLRLLKSEQVSSLEACAVVLGYSPRQLRRWWQLYRLEGLSRLTQPTAYAGKRSQLSPQAWEGLQAEMQAGHISTLQEARQYLQSQWHIDYRSLNGVWWQLRRHQAKLKTGRRQHRRAKAEQQEQFKKTSGRR
jgi:transposase